MMAISAFQAAKTLGSLTDWGLTNLQMQKILYLAHMEHLGWHGEPLVNGTFEAWDYGPVLPSVYHRLKCYGAEPARDRFYSSSPVTKGTEYEVLKSAAEKLANLPPATLVHYTHEDGGAWSKRYAPGARGRAIYNQDIKREYDDRRKRQKERRVA